VNNRKQNPHLTILPGRQPSKQLRELGCGEAGCGRYAQPWMEPEQVIHWLEQQGWGNGLTPPDPAATNG